MRDKDIAEKRIDGLTIRIDRGQCIATTNCMKVAGDVFELDGERICSFVAEPGAVERARLIEACSVCPVQALIVIDENGNRLVPRSSASHVKFAALKIFDNTA